MKEIVIKIPDKWFNDMVREEFIEVDELCALIQHSIILPEGHGDLIDRNILPVDFFINDKGNKECVVTYDALEDAPVLVSACKEGE